MAFVLDAGRAAAIRRELYSAAIGDVMDHMELRRQFLPARIRPLNPSMVVAGRARPVVVEDGEGTAEDPFGRLLEALDSLREDDVCVTNGGAIPFRGGMPAVEAWSRYKVM